MRRIRGSWIPWYKKTLARRNLTLTARERMDGTDGGPNFARDFWPTERDNEIGEGRRQIRDHSPKNHGNHGKPVSAHRGRLERGQNSSPDYLRIGFIGRAIGGR